MKSILVIDDEEQMVCVVREILESEGYRVLAASNGEEGLRLFCLEPADLVITDIFMAEKDGLETLRALRRLSPSAEVIAMSGGCSKMEGFQALDFAQALGATHTLKKPFDRRDLLDVVKLCLKA
jgi:CheY-like chemotaxis protein